MPVSMLPACPSKRYFGWKTGFFHGDVLTIKVTAPEAPASPVIFLPNPLPLPAPPSSLLASPVASNFSVKWTVVPVDPPEHGLFGPFAFGINGQRYDHQVCALAHCDAFAFTW